MSGVDSVSLWLPGRLWWEPYGPYGRIVRWGWHTYTAQKMPDAVYVMTRDGSSWGREMSLADVESKIEGDT